MNNFQISEPEDYTPFIIYITLGIPLIISYMLAYNSSDKFIKQIWSNRGQNSVSRYKFVYIISMLLAAAAGVYLFYYLSWGNDMKGMTEKSIFDYTYNKEGKYFIYASLLVLIGYSLLWIPSFVYKNDMIMNIVLFIIAGGAVLLMASIASIDWNKSTDEDKGAIASSSYIAFHTLVLDGLLWSGILL